MLKSLRYKLLVQQYKNKIYSYSYYMLKNRMDADDVTQEVLIRIWKNLGSFNPDAAGAWIMRTTHNLCLDYLRKRSTAVKRELNIDEDNSDKIKEVDRLTDPEVKARQEMLKLKIQESIERLPETLKSIFVMYELQGLKYREISEILDVPLNSVRVYLLRARKKLQHELREFKHEAIETY
jgi:RNA polymerase sigma-70 factor (ECF subfamily)